MEFMSCKHITFVRMSHFIKAINMVFFFTSSRLVMALIFLTYVLMGDILTAENAFLTLALLNIVKLSMTLFFPLGIQTVSEALISIKRIQNFLLLEEKNETSSLNVIKKSYVGNTGFLKLKQVTGKWSEQTVGNVLEGITFEAISGKLTAIVGPVGSGKGSILQAILGKITIYYLCFTNKPCMIAITLLFKTLYKVKCQLMKAK